MKLIEDHWNVEITRDINGKFFWKARPNNSFVYCGIVPVEDFTNAEECEISWDDFAKENGIVYFSKEISGF